MRPTSKFSRRTVVCALAIAPTVSASNLAAASSADDTKLVSLGSELASVWEAVAQTADHDQVMALLERTDRLSAAIVATPAETIAGLRVKARATAWALEDDLDPTKQSSQNERMAASIVRDLLEARTA